ncbi:TLC domain-containing protein 2 [Thecamonas trahens ATCC 50062]|uniref:TLC domain-containing protein 2 n=1 Tax=Thecamonas trahens ATCC 50062 TaxID=461836 RepID=A0A0L0DSD7_THETB|nr:TLC domain-containing protein 2 [Thecamonas trahens ATCC 50062]KNC54373.1 TLC domain-containing protein 2 [Thecamonas trahens ATCC 50062]|eukprot:XP_013753675.1 TLC domain-containing protein 2 [Thecamonas trahens ATCC 50062]
MSCTAPGILTACMWVYDHVAWAVPAAEHVPGALPTALGAFVFFAALNVAVGAVSRACLTFVASAPTKEQAKWNNIGTSLLHSLLIGVLSVAAIGAVGVRSGGAIDVLYNSDPLLRAVLAFSTGYFWYDTADMAINRMYLNQPIVWFHHVVVLTPFTLALLLDAYEPILVMGLVVEANTALQHARRLFTILHARSSLGFTVTLALLYGSFIPIRIAPHAAIAYAAICATHAGAFAIPWHAAVAILGSIFITIVDCGIFVVMLRSDWPWLIGRAPHAAASLEPVGVDDPAVTHASRHKAD